VICRAETADDLLLRRSFRLAYDLLRPKPGLVPMVRAWP
jgi:hypothetical protein